MRVLECMCGTFLRAEADDELFASVHEHVDRHHSDLRFRKERLRTIVANVAYYEENAPRCSFVAETQINRKGFEADPGVTGFGFAVGKKAAA
jgi:hypothetical protein